VKGRSFLSLSESLVKPFGPFYLVSPKRCWAKKTTCFFLYDSWHGIFSNDAGGNIFYRWARHHLKDANAHSRLKKGNWLIFLQKPSIFFVKIVPCPKTNNHGPFLKKTRKALNIKPTKRTDPRRFIRRVPITHIRENLRNGTIRVGEKNDRWVWNSRAVCYEPLRFSSLIWNLKLFFAARGPP